MSIYSDITNNPKLYLTLPDKDKLNPIATLIAVKNDDSIYHNIPNELKSIHSMDVLLVASNINIKKLKEITDPCEIGVFYLSTIMGFIGKYSPEIAIYCLAKNSNSMSNMEEVKDLTTFLKQQLWDLIDKRFNINEIEILVKKYTKEFITFYNILNKLPVSILDDEVVNQIKTFLNPVIIKYIDYAKLQIDSSDELIDGAIKNHGKAFIIIPNQKKTNKRFLAAIDRSPFSIFSISNSAPGFIRKNHSIVICNYYNSRNPFTIAKFIDDITPKNTLDMVIYGMCIIIWYSFMTLFAAISSIKFIVFIIMVYITCIKDFLSCSKPISIKSIRVD